MKLIESKAEYIPQEEGLEGIYKAIELAGRTAYHSLDKITPDSAKDFVDRMIKSKHGAALEHGTVYLLFDCIRKEYLDYHGQEYEQNPYSRVSFWCSEQDCDDRKYYITTNLRVLVENNCLDDLQYLCSPTESHEKRYTMRFTCSRGISHELVRSRTMSFLQESQRYINYSKERHGGNITYIIPSWLNTEGKRKECLLKGDWQADDWNYAEDTFLEQLDDAERAYITLLDNGYSPQQARDVLPNATKTELIMTGFASDWKHLFDLRFFEKTGKVHPDMLNLMQKAQKVMQEAGIWEDIMSKPSKFE